MAAERSPATDAAAALLTALCAQGVRHLVLSPGSRSQALALVAAELEARGELCLHVRIDERVAGFTALGIGRESGMPAVVVCTSGTAVANLLPAVLEAHHAGVPMLLLTADRPPELRGIGANQTTRQPGLFAGFVRFEAEPPTPTAVDPDGTGAEAALLRDLAREAAAAARGLAAAPAGPVHLNLPYREPLSGVLPPWFAVPEAAAPAAVAVAPVRLCRGPLTLVVAGADAGPEAEAFARAAGWPLVAEIVSGARFGPVAVPDYRAALRDPARGGRVQRAVVFGHPTLSREVGRLLARADLDVIAVRRGGEAFNPNGSTVAAGAVEVESGEAEGEAAWLAVWTAADLASGASTALDRAALVRAVWDATGEDDRLVFASSRLVRVADDILPARPARVHANRGLAGIDGTTATALGIALAAAAPSAHALGEDTRTPREHPVPSARTCDLDGVGVGAGVTRLLTGDLAFLHDVGALLLAPGEPAPRVQLIVGNDGGGTIFDGLEVAQVASAAASERVLYTPQRVDLAALATAYGWAYRRVETPAELAAALASPALPGIVEVPLAR